MTTHKENTMENETDTQKAAREIYSAATTELRKRHKPEFDTIVDAEYEKRGLSSPRMRRLAAKQEREAAMEAVAVRKAAKAAERVARLEAELAAARKAVESA